MISSEFPMTMIPRFVYAPMRVIPIYTAKASFWLFEVNLRAQVKCMIWFPSGSYMTPHALANPSFFYVLIENKELLY